MPVLSWIIVASLFGGALSVIAAAAFAFTARAAWVPHLISYAIGALLGAAFLEVLPNAVISSTDATGTGRVILFGLLGFFLLEKLVIWRHCHVEECEGHDPPLEVVVHTHHHDHGHVSAHNAGHDHGRSGLLIVVGDTFHNFVDGVLIASAFMADVRLGIVTALAIIAHEIPQEVGDFLILIHSGYSRGKAFMYNLLSSFATVVGGLLAYFALSRAEGIVPVMLGLAAASMIYVAVADLIPGLHKRTELKATIQQVVLIALGIASIAISEHFVDKLVPGI